MGINLGGIGGLLGGLNPAGLIGTGLSLAGGWLGMESQRQTNSMNRDMANAQMAFQERMSDTQWQRGVSDMEKAGLNPMLAYSQGGASSPGGATAPMASPLGAGAATAMQVADTMANINLKQAQAISNVADARQSVASAGHIEFENQFMQPIAKMVAEYGLSSAQFAALRDSTLYNAWVGHPQELADAEYQKLAADSGIAVQTLKQLREGWTPELQKKMLEAKMLKLDLPRAEATSEFYRRGGPDVVGIEKMGTLAGTVDAAGNAIGRGVAKVGDLFGRMLPSAGAARSFFQGARDSVGP